MSTNALATKVALAADSISNIPNIENAEELIGERLTQLGIYGENDLEFLLSADCTEGDARRVFCEDEPPVIPVPRFKRLWRILKEGAEKESVADHPTLMAATSELLRPHGQWKDEELLNAYGIDCEDGIIEALGKRSKGRPFIIFSDESNSVVDIKSTLSVLRLARRQETPATFPTDNGIKKLWPLGEFPTITQTECPIHPGTLLFGGYCDSCRKSWNGIDKTKMQFARLIAESGEGPEKPKEINVFIKELDGNEWMDIFEDYPNAREEMIDREHNGVQMPNLCKRTSSPKVKDPITPNSRNRKY